MGTTEILIAIIAALVILTGAQGFVIYMFVSNTKHNKAVVNRIQNKNKTLKAEKRELISKITYLEEKIQDLNKEIVEVSEECEDYKYAYTKLYRIHSTLEDNVNSLMSKGYIIRDTLYNNAIRDIVGQGLVRILDYKQMTPAEIEAFYGYLV